jgi:hypothetical protein
MLTGAPKRGICGSLHWVKVDPVILVYTFLEKSRRLEFIDANILHLNHFYSKGYDKVWLPSRQDANIISNTTE